MNPTNSSFCPGDGDSMNLRRPKDKTISRLAGNKPETSSSSNVAGNNSCAQSDFNNSNTSNPAIHSTLSVAASEFFPKSSEKRKPVTHTTLNASAPSYVPRQAQNNAVYQDYTPNNDAQIYNIVMQEFTKTVSILLAQPGNVEEYMKRLDEHLVNVRCHDTLESIVDHLYNQCINEPNFPYTGARICQHIHRYLKDHPVFKDFRSSLLKRVQRDFAARENLLSDPSTFQTVHGLAMFTSELFLNFQMVTPDGSSHKLQILSDCLVDLILSILNSQGKDNVKCAVQVLKLAGATLDDMNRIGVDKIFERLEQLRMNASVSERDKLMMKSVFDLHSNNWGRGESTSSATDDLNTSMSGLNLAHGLLESKPVFFNALGQECSRAEDDLDEEGDLNYMLNEEEDLDYLQWSQENNTDDLNQYPDWSMNDPYLYTDPYAFQALPEYSPDATEAYEQYLKNNMS